MIVTFCWVLGSIVGFLPLFGWHAEPNQACLFVEVMDYNYLVFLYVATIITPAILLLAFYVHIYTVIIKQVSIKNYLFYCTVTALRLYTQTQPAARGQELMNERIFIKT